MAGNKRPSFLKRQKEQQRMARAAEKRESRRQRKQAKRDGTLSVPDDDLVEPLDAESVEGEGADDGQDADAEAGEALEER